MISTLELLYKLDMRLNKKVSNESQGIPNEDKILALNEAQLKLIKRKLNQNNVFGLGLDSFKKRYEDLQTLAVPFEEMNVIKTSDIHTSYQADITTLKNKYFIPLDMYCICTRGECKNRVLTISRVAKHGDLLVLMANKHYNPSFDYQETLSVISSNNIIVYSNDPSGEFQVDNLYLSYLRYPRYIDIQGYIKFDGSESVYQDCELVDYLEDELLDLAVVELAMDTGNSPVISYNELRNKNNE